MNEYKKLKHKGIVAYNRKDYKESLQCFNEYLELDPTNPMAYYNICNVLEDTNELDEAEVFILKAIELDPNVSDFYFHLAGIYADKSDFKNSIINYKKAIKIEPEYLEALYNIGVMYKVTKEFEKAKEVFLKTIELDPEYFLSHSGLISIYLDEDNFVLAKKELDISLSICPNDPIVHHALSVYYFNVDELENALLEINTTIEIDEPDIVHKFLKIEILLALKRFEEAKDLCFHVAKELPDFKYTYELLGQYYFTISNYEKSEECFKNALVKDGTLVKSLNYLKDIYTIQKKEEFLEEIEERISNLSNGKRK